VPLPARAGEMSEPLPTRDPGLEPDAAARLERDLERYEL
jgi:hypothetical protein